MLIFLLAAAFLRASPAGALEPDFSGWKQVRTEHFVFIHEERDREAVEELVSFAEDVYDDVTLFLDSRPREVWVVVRGRIDEANGYTSTNPPHIVLYLAPPSEPLIGLDASSYLRLLLVHELTHYVNFQYDRGVLSVLASLFGPGVKGAESFLYGFAMMEGVATEAETRFTDGGRGRNPFFELGPRALAFEHAFFSLRQVSYGSSYPPLDRVWVGGYLLVHHLFDHYGPDVMRRIRAAYAAAPLGGPWAAIRQATGKDAAEIFQDLVRELELRYRPAAEVPDGRLVSPAIIGNYFLPVVTDRGWYVYRRTLDQPGAIILFDPATRAERVLLPTGLSDASSLTASGNGEKVVFAATEETVGKSGPILVADLFALEPGSSTARRITTGAHLWQPRLSPDGSRLIAVEAVGSRSRLVNVDQRTGELATLFSVEGTIICTPVFSPDGSKLAFDMHARGVHAIWILSTDSGEAVPLLRGDGGQEYYPHFIDATRILFSSDRGGSLALYSASLDGSGLAMLCEDPVGAWAGLMIGDRIVYGTYRSQGYVLMEKAPRDEAVEQHVVDRSAAREATEPRLETQTYSDFPRLLFWSPLPVYYSTIAGDELILAPGVILSGLSNLESNAITAAFSFRTDSLQPAVELDVRTSLGTAGFSYSLSEGYTALSSSSFLQELRQHVAFSFPLVSRTLFRTTTTLTVTAAVVDSLLQRGGESFTFADGLGIGPDESSLAFEHDLGFGAGLAFVRGVDGSDWDLFSREKVLVSVATSFYPPILSGTGIGTVSAGLFSLSMPSPFAHHVVKLGTRFSFTTFTEPFVQITNPRGGFGPVSQTLPGRALLAIDYQYPIALLDAPLVYALGLIAIGGSVHLEAAADVGLAPPSLVPDEDMYAGAEILLVLSVGEGSVPLVVGASLRFDPRFENPVDWSKDLRPYVLLSSDSFAGSGLANIDQKLPTYRRAP
jgi:hypothetical protein